MECDSAAIEIIRLFCAGQSGGNARLGGSFAYLPANCPGRPESCRCLEPGRWRDVFLRGVVEIQLGDKSAAKSDLAFVFEGPSPLREKAARILQILAGRSVPLETFVKALPARRVNQPLRDDVEPAAFAHALATGYAGPKACQACHEKEYTAWRMTGMAKMLQPYRAANILGDFSTHAEYQEGQGAAAEAVRLGSDSRPYFAILTHGTWIRYRVDFTIVQSGSRLMPLRCPMAGFRFFPLNTTSGRRSGLATGA
jgi:hypothetical protein